MSHDQNFLLPLIATIKDLSAIISEEIALLKNSRPQEMDKLLPLKNQLMATYYKEMSDLSARGGLQACGNGDAVRQLKQESRVFQSLLIQHTKMVKALKSISENMIKAISDEVVKKQHQSSRYGANGARSVTKSPTSITLNQKI